MTPTPTPSADDLRALSDAASPGEWRVTDDFALQVDFDDDRPLSVIRPGYGAPCWPWDAAYIVALVNRDRAQQAQPTPSGDGREALRERIAASLRTHMFDCADRLGREVPFYADDADDLAASVLDVLPAPDTEAADRRHRCDGAGRCIWCNPGGALTPEAAAPRCSCQPYFCLGEDESAPTFCRPCHEQDPEMPCFAEAAAPQDETERPANSDALTCIDCAETDRLFHHVARERDAARAEVERLRAQVAAVRTWADLPAFGLSGIDPESEHGASRVGWNMARDAVRAALDAVLSAISTPSTPSERGTNDNNRGR